MCIPGSETLQTLPIRRAAIGWPRRSWQGREACMATAVSGVEVTGPAIVPGSDRVLTPEALAFVADLHRRFNPTRERLLAARAQRQERIEAPARCPTSAPTRPRSAPPTGASAAPRPTSTTAASRSPGPAEPKMMINALNSGARVFMADLEDALSPTWANVVGGQAALQDAVRRELEFTSPEGKAYRLNDEIATLLVRPRGWHLDEAHVLVDGEPISASLFDFGLYFFHNAAELLRRGSGPVLLPAQDGGERRGAPLERRLRRRPGGARHPARHDPRDRADRDDPRRVRDGRDPLRAARARRRASTPAAGTTSSACIKKFRAGRTSRCRTAPS